MPVATTELRVTRTRFLPFCLPSIGQEEIDEVVDSLKSGWVTTGPKVKRFENDFATYVGARHAIAVSSCTAALHISLAALGLKPGDEVIVPTLTFCATANVVVHLGATPVIVDVDESMQICPAAIRKSISPKTRAIVPVHYAGQACDLDQIIAIASEHGIPVIEDAAHAIGSEYKGRKIGVHGKAVAFSFYATKNMTTGEGGMITTDDDELAARMRLLSLHGMSRDAWKRYTQTGSWFYEVIEPGFKNNMTDVQASLGIHQLAKLETFTRARQRIAAAYNRALAHFDCVDLPAEKADRNHVYHLYPMRLQTEKMSITRSGFIEQMSEALIGTSVHFIPLHKHPAYASLTDVNAARFPVAERLYEGLVSLPCYPGMTETDVADVISATSQILETARR